LETNEVVVESPTPSDSNDNQSVGSIETDSPSRSVTEVLNAAGSSVLESDTFREIEAAAYGDPDGRSLMKSHLSEWRGFSSSFSQQDNSNVLQGFVSLTVGRSADAAKILAKEKSVWGRYFYLRSLLALMKVDQAAKAADEVLNDHGGHPELSLLAVEVYCKARREEDALRVLNSLESELGETADFLYHKGLYLERNSDYDEAIDSYREAVKVDEGKIEAFFRLGFCLDLYGKGGDETIDEAIGAYESCLRVFPPHTNAVINLGILYEDRERYHDAIKCFEAVLRFNPNHPRAKLFLEDAIACTKMFYDKEEEKKADRQSQVLKIPVSDFELSVRSRNCLHKMNINSLGDLIMKTEQELLSYKNFGETSLKEIKDMLTQKGLRLGQGLEQSGPDLNQPRNPLEATTSPDVLNKPIEELNLSVRSRRCMERLGVKSIRDLINRTEVQLMSAKNFGMTSLNEIKRKLSELNLRLRG